MPQNQELLNQANEQLRAACGHIAEASAAAARCRQLGLAAPKPRNVLQNQLEQALRCVHELQAYWKAYEKE